MKYPVLALRTWQRFRNVAFS